VAEKAGFFSRFFYKILEIMGAAVATAVSGYFVAHLGGFLPSQNQLPPRPEVAIAPSEHSVPKSTPINTPASQTATAPQPTQSASTPPSPEPRPPSSQQEATGSAGQTVVRKTAKAPPARKSGKAETAATEPSRPHETTDAKPRETTETKPRDSAEVKPRDPAEAKARDSAETKPRDAEDRESVEARVRAALANVDANRPQAAEVPPRHGEGQAGAGSARPAEASPGATAAIPARPLELPSASANVGASAGQQPHSADIGPGGLQPTAGSQSPAVQPAAVSGQTGPAQPAAPQQPEALTAVEIKSRPVATVDTPRVSEAPPPEEKGVFSALKRILPDFSHPASNDEAPRPPAPVGD
jgi:hypothetical protein